MRVNDTCSRNVASIRRDESVFEAAQKMRRYHVGTLVVIEDAGGRRIPVGIVTDRDIVVNGVARVPEDMTAIRVADVMTTAVHTVSEDSDLEDALRRMRHYGVRRLPVVNDTGEISGVLALDDILEATTSRLDGIVELIAREQRLERAARA